MPAGSFGNPAPIGADTIARNESPNDNGQGGNARTDVPQRPVTGAQNRSEQHSDTGSGNPEAPSGTDPQKDPPAAAAEETPDDNGSSDEDHNSGKPAAATAAVPSESSFVPPRWLTTKALVSWASAGFRGSGPRKRKELLTLEAEVVHKIKAIKLIDWFVFTVLSIIGGIGKTMTAAYLLYFFGVLREDDRGVGVDINPDMGLYADRLGIPKAERLSLKDAYNRRVELKTYTKIRRLIPFRNGSALIGAELADTDFYKYCGQRKVDAIIRCLMPITSGVFFDAGTGLLSTPINEAALARTHVPVLLADFTDSSQMATETALRELEKHGYTDKAANGVLVLNRVQPGEDFQPHYDAFGDKFRAIIEVPWNAWMANKNNPVNPKKITLEARVALLQGLLAVLEGVQADADGNTPPDMELNLVPDEDKYDIQLKPYADAFVPATTTPLEV